MLHLRDYQLDMVMRARQAFAAGNRHVILQAPTGAGKTIIAAHVAKSAADRGKRILVLAHRRELLFQLHGKITLAGLRAGLIMPGQPETNDTVQVASVQSIAKKARRYNFDFIMTDEAHHAIPGSLYSHVFEANPEAMSLGLTATPQRLDGKGLGKISGGFYDAIVPGPSPAWLIQNGYLCRYRAFSHPPPAGDLRMTGGDFNKADMEAMMDQSVLIGDAVDHYRKLADGRRAICFCVSVEHAKNTAEAFRRAGYSAIAVDGGMEKADRAAALAGLQTGKNQIITSCELISEGLDVPNVGAVILMRPTASVTLFLQAVGRGMRPKEDGSELIILDHAGNIARHGLPDQDRTWGLEGRIKKERAKLPPIRECAKCFAVFPPADHCPECGALVERAARRELETEDGTLVEVTAEALEAMRKAKRREEGRAQTLEDLLRIERERGYKSGWAYLRWNARRKK